VLSDGKHVRCCMSASTVTRVELRAAFHFMSSRLVFAHVLSRASESGSQSVSEPLPVADCNFKLLNSLDAD